jgi:hypothetical protein
MALRLVGNASAQRLRGAHADLWRTLAAWIWATYVLVIGAALLWWML